VRNESGRTAYSFFWFDMPGRDIYPGIVFEFIMEIIKKPDQILMLRVYERNMYFKEVFPFYLHIFTLIEERIFHSLERINHMAHSSQKPGMITWQKR
jgi:hypothetical protein